MTKAQLSASQTAVSGRCTRCMVPSTQMNTQRAGINAARMPMVSSHPLMFLSISSPPISLTSHTPYQPLYTHPLVQVNTKSRKLSVSVHAAAAAPPQPAQMAPEYVKAPGQGVGIYRGTDGFLYVDGVKVDDIRAQAETSPVYIYSKEKIRFVLPHRIYTPTFSHEVIQPTKHTQHPTAQP